MQVMIDFKKCEKLKAKSDYMKTYYQDNRPARLTYQQRYDKQHRAERAQRMRLARAKNREKYNADRRAYRAKKNVAARCVYTLDTILTSIDDLQGQMQVVMHFLHRIEKGQSHC